MLDQLIREGYRYADFDEMTMEDLYDLVDAKARLKQARKDEKRKPSIPQQQGNIDNSLEQLLLSSGILK